MSRSGAISPKGARRSTFSPATPNLLSMGSITPASPGLNDLGSASPSQAPIEVEESVKVICRVRPFNSREIELHNRSNENKQEWDRYPIRSIVEFNGKTCIFLDHEHDWTEKERFVFDCCLWSVPDEMQTSENGFSGQDALYNDFGCQVLAQAWKGYNTCFFAYGQTGSGKTYSMMGEVEDTENSKADPGLIPRICRNLFEQIETALIEASENKDKFVKSFKVGVQYMEIYNEMVKDLLWGLSELTPEIKAKINCENLKIRTNPVTGVFVEHLTSITVNSWQEMMRLIDLGNNSRTTASTKMNERSSRSHAIFKIMLTQIMTSVPKKQFEKPTEHIRESFINLVDLAGSERNKKTGATGDRLKEAASINKSLSTLKSVIDALVENCTTRGPKKRIPYRDSHLTSILMDSIGGNSKTFMLVTVSPHLDNYEETLQTLKYGSRARSIVSVVHINENAAGRMMFNLEEELKRMRDELQKADEDENSSEAVEDLRAQIHQHEDQMRTVEAEIKAQQTKLAELQREREKKTKHRQMLAFQKMEGLSSMVDKTSAVAVEEATLRRQLSSMTHAKTNVEMRKSDLEGEIEAFKQRIADLENQKDLIENETEQYQKKVAKTESLRWETQRKLEDTVATLKKISDARIAYLMRFRLDLVRGNAAHEKRLANITKEHAEQLELVRQKQKRQNEDIFNENNNEVITLEQQRDNMRTDLNALKAELQRVEGERTRQLAQLEEKVNNLESENKKRKEAMTSRIISMTASYEKRYTNMVATMEKQYRELIDECNKRHQAEEERQEQQLTAVRQRHAHEVRELEKEWRVRIDNAITKGKKEFQDSKNKWERQLQERRHIMEELRVKLREMDNKETDYSGFARRVAATLERTDKPRYSAVAKRFYDLLELYHGQHEECRPSRATLEHLLTNDVNKRRCANPPTLGLNIDDFPDVAPAVTEMSHRCSLSEFIPSSNAPTGTFLKTPAAPEPTAATRTGRADSPNGEDAGGRQSRGVSPARHALFFSARIRSRSQGMFTET